MDFANQKARFEGRTPKGDICIYVHFNPSEYSITPSTDEDAKDYGGFGDTIMERLNMKLTFDTYMTPLPVKEDVRLYTEEIAVLANPPKVNKPMISFIWGSVRFNGRLVVNSQRFTMFMGNGKPVRAELEITMFGSSVRSGKQEIFKGINWAVNDWKSTVLGNPRMLL